MCGTCGCKSAETLSKTSCCCGADEANPCACMKAPEPMNCSATEPKCQCYKDLEKNAEFLYYYVLNEKGESPADFNTLEEAQTYVANSSEPLEIYERRSRDDEAYKMDKKMNAESLDDMKIKYGNRDRIFFIKSVDYDTDGEITNDELPQEFTIKIPSDYHYFDEDADEGDITDVLNEWISTETGFSTKGIVWIEEENNSWRKSAEYDEEDMVSCRHCWNVIGNEKEVYGDETVEYEMANGELVCVPCYKEWKEEYKNDLDPHYSPFYAESFEASNRKCGACGETGHNARTCKSKSVPFSTGGLWNEKTFDGLEQLGLPFVDASHVAMISKIVDGEVLKEPNARVQIPRITWKEEPITMTWGELDKKCKKQDLVSIGESTYSGAYLRSALAYLPKNTVLNLYTDYHFPLKATFEYGGEEWILILAPRVAGMYAESFEAERKDKPIDNPKINKMINEIFDNFERKFGMETEYDNLDPLSVIFPFAEGSQSNEAKMGKSASMKRIILERKGQYKYLGTLDTEDYRDWGEYSVLTPKGESQIKAFEKEMRRLYRRDDIHVLCKGFNSWDIHGKHWRADYNWRVSVFVDEPIPENVNTKDYGSETQTFEAESPNQSITTNKIGESLAWNNRIMGMGNQWRNGKYDINSISQEADVIGYTIVHEDYLEKKLDWMGDGVNLGSKDTDIAEINFAGMKIYTGGDGSFPVMGLYEHINDYYARTQNKPHPRGNMTMMEFFDREDYEKAKYEEAKWEYEFIEWVRETYEVAPTYFEDGSEMPLYHHVAEKIGQENIPKLLVGARLSLHNPVTPTLNRRGSKSSIWVLQIPDLTHLKTTKYKQNYRGKTEVFINTETTVAKFFSNLKAIYPKGDFREGSHNNRYKQFTINIPSFGEYRWYCHEVMLAYDSVSQDEQRRREGVKRQKSQKQYRLQEKERMKALKEKYGAESFEAKGFFSHLKRGKMATQPKDSELWEEVGKLYATKNQLFEVIGTDECSMCNEKLENSKFGLAYKKFKPKLTDESPVICGKCFDSLTPDDWQYNNGYAETKGMQNMKKNPKIKVFRYVEDVGCRCPRCQWNIKFAQLLRDGTLVDGELPPNWAAKIGKSLPKVWIEDYEKDYPDLTYRDTKKGNFTAYDWGWMSFYRCASCNGKHYAEDNEKIPFMARHYKPKTGRNYVYFEKPSGYCKFCGNKKVLNEAESFEAVVIRQGDVPKGAMAKAMMNKSMMEQANIEAMIQELENKVNLGLISEKDLMESLKKKFGAEYDIEELSKEDLEAYFADLKRDNPKLAKQIEFKVKSEEYLPKKLIESSGYDYEILEAWNDSIIDDDKYALFDPCEACEGEGWILTSYTPATRWDPADGDGEDCEACGGSGLSDPSDYMYYDDKGDIQYEAETKISKICPNCEQNGKSKKDATTDYICDFCAQCKRCCETSYGCYDVALCNDCDGSFIGKDIDGCCGSCDNCCECGDY